jgi:4-diphosphocytidyl-2-C-methyl-D-erythritol kinase
VVPPINVSTALIYRKWDNLRLTTTKSGVKLISLALQKNDLFVLTPALYNGLEPVTEALFPAVRAVKERLRACGVRLIMMSGSGPAVFGIVSSKKEAVTVINGIKKEHPFWKVFLAKSY